MHKARILILLIILSSCNTQNKTSQQKTPKKEQTNISNNAFRFEPNDEFQIVRFEHSNEYELTDSACNEWKLSESDIEQILKLLIPINGSQWHYEFGQYPCYVNGILNQNENNFKFSINSGSWLTISSDTTIFYGDIDGKLTNLFLDDRWTEEDYQ
ncbi:MAG: hypothetical protein R8N23_15865 [Reichenbachiella sp.]|uniref:hypothetical protein n=1 Tax=Reichenbachiella sp. TaxID=2184521 RepID=UPI0029674F80|nr:hypothetical protein [Reichenbachiella sp.]MDW3211353.1 hypothetical protein [Reichenbachiella sp.]